jgi:hypothetical protein
MHRLTNTDYSKLLKELVGAGRFERPTPLRPRRFPAFRGVPYLQTAGFIGDVRGLLKAIELY